MNTDRFQPDFAPPNRRKRRAALLVLALLALPALAICCALSALQVRSNDPPLADYSLGPLALHTAPGYVACPPASPTPCFTRWYIIRVALQLPTLDTWGFDMWAPFLDSRIQAAVPSALAMWYHGGQSNRRLHASEEQG